MQNNVAVCVGFFSRSYATEYRVSEFHSYFEKLWCIYDSEQVQLTPPQVHKGLKIRNLQSNVLKLAPSLFVLTRTVINRLLTFNFQNVRDLIYKFT